MRRWPSSPGDTIALALLRAGLHPGRGGTLCLAGDCPNCLCAVDGVAYVRSCQTPARDGAVVLRQGARGVAPCLEPGCEASRCRSATRTATWSWSGAARAAWRRRPRRRAPRAGRCVEIDARDGEEAVGIYDGPAARRPAARRDAARPRGRGRDRDRRRGGPAGRGRAASSTGLYTARAAEELTAAGLLPAGSRCGSGAARTAGAVRGRHHGVRRSSCRPRRRRAPARGRRGRARPRPAPARRARAPGRRARASRVVGDAAAPAGCRRRRRRARRLPLHRHDRGGPRLGLGARVPRDGAGQARHARGHRHVPGCRLPAAPARPTSPTAPATAPPPFTARPMTRQITMEEAAGRRVLPARAPHRARRRASRPRCPHGAVRRLVAAVDVRRHRRRVPRGARGGLARRRLHARQGARRRPGRGGVPRAHLPVPGGRPRAGADPVRAAARRARLRVRRRRDRPRRRAPVHAHLHHRRRIRRRGLAARLGRGVRRATSGSSTARRRSARSTSPARTPRSCSPAAVWPSRPRSCAPPARVVAERAVRRHAARLHRRAVVRAPPRRRPLGRAVAGADGGRRRSRRAAPRPRGAARRCGSRRAT